MAAREAPTHRGGHVTCYSQFANSALAFAFWFSEKEDGRTIWSNEASPFESDSMAEHNHKGSDITWVPYSSLRPRHSVEQINNACRFS
jgi:hypothetical protein